MSMPRSGRSAWPCSKPTSTSRWSRPSSSASARTPPGQDVLKSLTPDQAVLRIVRDEMVELLGGGTPPRLDDLVRAPLRRADGRPAGLGQDHHHRQARAWLVKGGHHPLLVSTDVYRPAAREQLKTLGERNGLKVHHPEGRRPARAAALGACRGPGGRPRLRPRRHRRPAAHRRRADGGAQELKARAQPSEILYVADAMTGQDAVRSADGVPPAHRHDRHRAHQARWRRARRRRALGGLGHGLPGQVRGHRREAWTSSSSSSPRAWSRRILGHGRRARAHREGRADVRPRPGRGAGRASYAATSSRSRISATRCASCASWGPLDQVLSMLPGMGCLEGRRRGRGRARDAPLRGHHRLDDAARAARARRDQRQPPQAHRARQRHPASRT